MEMIYALDKVAPGTANDDTLLYGVEVKFYNMEVDIDENLESCHKGLYVIGDGSGVTHSLSHASASGVYVARHIIGQPMGTGKAALTSENGEIKRNVSFGKSKPELTFLFIISSKEADRKKEYKKILK